MYARTSSRQGLWKLRKTVVKNLAPRCRLSWVFLKPTHQHPFGDAQHAAVSKTHTVSVGEHFHQPRAGFFDRACDDARMPFTPPAAYRGALFGHIGQHHAGLQSANEDGGFPLPPGYG